VLFGREGAGNNPKTLLPSQPSPAHTPPTPAPSWLRSFAVSPRVAPTPPQRKRASLRATMRSFLIQESMKRAHLWTGLLFTLSLLITWFPGAVDHLWKLVRPLETSFTSQAAQATIFPLHGFWTAAIFFGINWKTLQAAPKRSSMRDTFSGLLEEPLSHFRGHSFCTLGGDVEATKRALKRLTVWPSRGPVQSDGWDFVDIGIPSRKGTVRSVRSRNEPGMTPLLPCPPRSFP
jgi:hypothetical protein